MWLKWLWSVRQVLLHGSGCEGNVLACLLACFGLEVQYIWTVYHKRIMSPDEQLSLHYLVHTTPSVMSLLSRR
jgi:hypothetical protein